MRSLHALTAAVLVVAFTLLVPTTSLSQSPIRLGFAYVFSGRLAHYGHGAQQGAQMAIDEINAAGGVNGRRLEAYFEDTKLQPEEGVKAVTKLVKEHHVDVVLGIVSSAVASAVAPVMNELKTPFIITLAMTPDVTGKICNPYTFRISMNGPQNIRGASALAAGMKRKKWTTIGPDYLFGYQCWEYFQHYLKEKRPDVAFASQSEIAYVPVTSRDFTPALDKVMKSDSDGVLISVYGGNLIDLIRQGNEMGFFSKDRAVLMNLAYSADVMQVLGLELPKGVWLSGLYWFQANSNPTNLEFVRNYTKRYKFWPDYNAHGGYSGVIAYVAALQKAGSEDKKAVIKALEGLQLDLPVGTVVIRPGDHQAVMDGCWGVADEFDRQARCRILKPMKIFPGAEITPPVDQTGCRLPRQ